MPRKAVTSEAKRFALNMKTTEEIRRRLEEAARASGRSLTHEVEHRLELSLQEEDLLRRYFGSDDTIELLKGLALVINHHSRRSHRPWQTDKATRDAIRETLVDVFDALDRLEIAEELQSTRMNYAPLEASSLWDLGVEDEDSSEITAESNRHQEILDASAAQREAPDSSAKARLTDTQVEILRYMTDGHSTKMIAQKCGMEEAKVEFYIKYILRGLKVRDRAQAIVWARQHLKFSADNHDYSSRDAAGSVLPTPPVRPRRGRAA